MINIDNLRQILDGFIGVIPRIVGALIIFIIGFIIAKIVRRLVLETLKKLQIDRFADIINNSDFLANSKFKVFPSLILSSIIYYFMLLIFLVAATDILGIQALSSLISDIINWIPNLVTALAILMIGFILADSLKKTVVSTCKNLGIPSASFIGDALFYFILINVVISALGQAKVNTQFIGTNISILIAGLSLAFAIGYGLASKDVVANFLVSFYSKEKIKVGQKVRIDDSEGTIIDLDKTSLTLDCNDRTVVIPLNKLAKGKIEIFNKQ
ncbi:MAG: mechanosensitive ion channel [Saprospiraceae bacterium]|nr:mechanosensitive ion channel [Saprospiraceae bacterium]